MFLYYICGYFNKTVLCTVCPTVHNNTFSTFAMLLSIDRLWLRLFNLVCFLVSQFFFFMKSKHQRNNPMRPLTSHKGVLSFHMTLNKFRTQVRYITDGLPTINYNHMTQSILTSNIVCVLWTLTIGLKCVLFLKVQDKSSKFHPFCYPL